MIRFRSVTTNAIVAATSRVTSPTTATMSEAVGASPKTGQKRAIRYTPAVTMVAAWIRAETGVGPSIASGSQVWSGIWADLAKAPTISSRQITIATPWLVWKVDWAAGEMAWRSKVWRSREVEKAASTMP